MKTIISALLVLAACGGSVPHYDYAKEPDPRRSEYVIGVPDHLTIRVWKNPDLSTDVIVRPDGTITLPLLGDLVAAGRTPSQLRTEIQHQLANFIRDESAVVTVAVTGVASYSFTVAGNVEHPGVFSAQKYITVLDAVQMAGGPNRYAGSEVRLYRQDKTGQRIIPIDYRAVQEGKQPDANLALLPGDQLYVP
jgi:polysaccharide export outer membrane protein